MSQPPVIIIITHPSVSEEQQTMEFNTVGDAVTYLQGLDNPDETGS